MSWPAEVEAAEDDERAALERALALCYRHVSRREHTAAQLRERLVRAGTGPAAADEAIAILLEQNYVNDERYTRLLVEDRRRIDGWGAERIRGALRAAGVAEELVDAALDGFDTQTELAAASALIRSRCQLPLEDDRQRRRALGMLLQRGFASETAYDAVRAASVT